MPMHTQYYSKFSATWTSSNNKIITGKNHHNQRFKNIMSACFFHLLDVFKTSTYGVLQSKLSYVFKSDST